MSHSRLSPSGWATWSNCPGAPALQTQVPEPPAERYQDEGSAFAYLINQLLDGHTAKEMLGRDVDVSEVGEEARLVTITPEMLEHAAPLVDWVAITKAEMELLYGPVRVLSEVKVDPEPLLNTPDCKGTLDLALVSPGKIVILDIKYGVGESVEVEVIPPDGGKPELNGQVMLYLLGLLAEYDGVASWEMEIGIYQPRDWRNGDGDHQKSAFRFRIVTHAEVVAFAERAKAAAAAASRLDASRTPSLTACRWCRAKPICPEVEGQVAEILGTPGLRTEATKEALVDAVEHLPASRIADILDNLDFIRGFLAAVEKYAVNQLTAGEAPEALASRWKLVQGKGNRRWIGGTEEVLKGIQAIRWIDPVTGKTTALRKPQLLKQAVKSPAEIEKMLRQIKKEGLITQTHWEAFEHLIERPLGSLKLAPVTDASPNARPTVDEMFADVK